MPDISKITFPSGTTYDIKDAVARQAIAGGVSFIIAWNGSSAPTIANIPAGVTVTYNDTDYTGTLDADDSQAGAFYLVKSATQENSLDVYDEYVAIGTTGSKTWEKIGDTQLNLGNLGDLAYLDTVTLNKGAGDVVLGEATTFTNSSSEVTFTGGSTKKCLGSSATFTTSVTPTTTNIKATASGTALSTNNDTFVKSYPGSTSKMVTTSIPNVTGNSSATLTFAMGTGDNSETLIISGTGFAANSNTYTATNTTLGAAITAATGGLANNGSGDSVMTGLGTATTASALTSASVSTQPTVALSTGATAGTGVISVSTGITSATTSVDSKDEATAITALGTGTAAAQTITVGTNDKITVAKHGDLSISTS